MEKFLGVLGGGKLLVDLDVVGAVGLFWFFEVFLQQFSVYLPVGVTFFAVVLNFYVFMYVFRQSAVPVVVSLGLDTFYSFLVSFLTVFIRVFALGLLLLLSFTRPLRPLGHCVGIDTWITDSAANVVTSSSCLSNSLLLLLWLD